MADLVTFARSPLGQDITLDPNAGGILIQGATGSGKSSCALSIALSLARMGFSLCCLNPKYIGWSALAPVAHIVIDDSQFVKVMQSCADELRRRFLNMSSQGREVFVPSAEEPRFALIVEEVAALTSANPDKRSRDAFLQSLLVYSNMSRAAGMCLVLICQSCDSTTIPTAVRSNAAAKIGLRSDWTQWGMLIGEDEEALSRTLSVTDPGELLARTSTTDGWERGRTWLVDEDRARREALEIASDGHAVVPPFLDFNRPERPPDRL